MLAALYASKLYSKLLENINADLLYDLPWPKMDELLFLTFDSSITSHDHGQYSPDNPHSSHEPCTRDISVT